MLPAGLTRFGLKSLDWAARSLRLRPQLPASAITGQRGEEEAYFYLRKLGYTMIARNWRSPRRRGEIDLIGMDGDVLCFIEVKTRGSRAVKPAEAAVDADKQFELAATAREYLRRYPGNPQVRFDVISIYIEAGGASPDITLFKNAFAVS